MKQRPYAKTDRKPMAVFLSHATADAPLAIKLKKWLKQILLGQVEVIVSGDSESLAAGQQWLRRISTDLRRSKLVILLCTPATVDRFWTTFEAGGAFFLEKPIIPLCAQGTAFAKLPIPLQLHQGYLAWEPSQLRQLVERIAEAAELNCPELSEDAIAALARQFGGGRVGDGVGVWVGDRTADDEHLLEQITQRHGPVTHIRTPTCTTIVGLSPSFVVFRPRGDDDPRGLIEELRGKLPAVLVILYVDGTWVARNRHHYDATLTIEALDVLRALSSTND